MCFSKLTETPISPIGPLREVITSNFAKAIPPAVADAQRIFVPPTPTSTPAELFSVQINKCSVRAYRFIRKNDREEVLLFADGCGNATNGSSTARAGFAAIFSPLQWHPPISGRLEQDGNPQTAHRAELRSVLAAIGLRYWYGEGFKRIVVACSSEYVINGVSRWMAKWREDGWEAEKGVVGTEIENVDLWKWLDRKLRELEEREMLVQFWLVPRGLNEAEEYARAGAEMDPVVGRVRNIALVAA